jgi:hypothetical protein
VVGNKLGTPEAIGGSWEGMVYTRVFLSDMRERLGAQGFDGDAYVADWESDLEHVPAFGPFGLRVDSASIVAIISPRIGFVSAGRLALGVTTHAGHRAGEQHDMQHPSGTV